MFRFEHPSYFYFFAVWGLLILLHYYAKHRTSIKLHKFGDVDLVKQLLVGVSPLRLEVKFWLFQLALASFIVALARPQFGTKVEKIERHGIECVIALDVSNSMLAEDVKPNRLEKAKMLISTLTDDMTDDKIGLIVFAGQAFTLLPITNDYLSAKIFLETINPSMVSVQGTDLAEAILLGTKSFTAHENVSKALFVITDGEDNEGRAEEAIEEAKNAGIHVYMMGIGNPNGAPIPIPNSNRFITDEYGNVVVSKLNETMCKTLAQKADGAYIYVDNSSSAQEQLKQHIDKLSKTTLETQLYSNYNEQYQFFVILGLVFLFIDLLLIEKKNPKLSVTDFLKRM